MGERDGGREGGVEGREGWLNSTERSSCMFWGCYLNIMVTVLSWLLNCHGNCCHGYCVECWRGWFLITIQTC